MSFPKTGVKKLLEKYPHAEKVIQFRLANREGDVVCYEGIMPAGLSDVLFETCFAQAVQEVSPPSSEEKP